MSPVMTEVKNGMKKESMSSFWGIFQGKAEKKSKKTKLVVD